MERNKSNERPNDKTYKDYLTRKKKGEEEGIQPPNNEGQTLDRPTIFEVTASKGKMEWTCPSCRNNNDQKYYDAHVYMCDRCAAVIEVDDLTPMREEVEDSSILVSPVGIVDTSRDVMDTSVDEEEYDGSILAGPVDVMEFGTVQDTLADVVENPGAVAMMGPALLIRILEYAVDNLSQVADETGDVKLHELAENLLSHPNRLLTMDDYYDLIPESTVIENIVPESIRLGETNLYKIMCTKDSGIQFPLTGALPQVEAQNQLDSNRDTWEDQGYENLELVPANDNAV